MKTRLTRLFLMLAIAAGSAVAFQGVVPEEASGCCAYWKERQVVVGGYICWQIPCDPSGDICCDVIDTRG